MAKNFKAKEKCGPAGSGRLVGALLCTTALALTLPAGPSWAQSVSWTGGTGEWSAGANWTSGAAPGAGNDVFITNGGTAEIGSAAAARTLDVGGSGGTSGNLTIDAGGSLTLSGAFEVGNSVSGASLLDINGGTLLQTGSVTWVRASGSLVLHNGGVIDVSGNSNGGALGVNGGTLVIGDGGGSVLATSIWGYGTPGQVIFDNSDDSTFSTQIDDVIEVVHDGAGTTTLSGNNTYTGGTTLNAGVISVSLNSNLGAANGILTFDGGTLQTTADFSMNRATTIGAGGGTFDVTAGTLTQAGVISGSGPLDKTGIGTLTLTGNSSGFTGTTTVTDGTLRLEGLLGGNKTVLGTGVIEAAVANAFNNGTHTFQQGSRLDALVAGAVSCGSFNFYQSSALNASVSGAVSGSNLVLLNNAVLNANAQHAIDDSTVTLLANARVNIGADNALTADTHLTFDRPSLDPGIGGILNLNGYSTELGSIRSGYSVGHGLGLITNDGSSDSVLTLNNAAASTTFSGVIQDGSGKLGLALAAGALTLDNAANTYSGGTTVLGGTLTAGRAGAFVDNTDYTVNGGSLDLNGFDLTMSSLSGTGGTVALGSANLTVQQNVNTSFAGALTGAGDFSKSGAGILTLTGNSSAFTGTTTVSEGTLVLEDLLGGSKSIRQTGTLDLRVADAVAGETVKVEDWGVVNLSVTGAGNGAIFDLDDNATVNVLANNALSATSTVYFTDQDTKLRLNGYSTTVGRLTVSNDERGIITNEGSSQHAVLTVVGQSGDSSFTGTIEDGSGSGTLGLTLEDGILDLWGANTYTGGTTVNGGTLTAIRAGAFVDDTAYAINGGTLDLGGFDLTMSSLSGAGGTVALGAADLTVNQATDTTYAGVLTGTGDFIKSGTGTLTLTGDSSAFASTTTVGSGGALVVGVGGSGALGGALTVGAGGRLGGTGTVGSAGLSTIIAAGAVHAPGNSIGMQHIAGDYVNNGTLVIEATPTAADQLVVAGAVDITGASLELLLSPTDAASWDIFNGPFTIIDKQSAGAVVGTFSPVTSNLLFLDTILDYAGGDGNDVTLELLRNDIAFASTGITRNQIATGTAIEALGSGHLLWNSIALATDPDLVRASFDALSGEVHASMKTALIDDSRFIRNAVNDRLRAAFDEGGASGGVDTTDGSAFWGQAFGSWGQIDGDGNAASLDHSTGGLLFGADVPVFDDWRLGAVAGYSNTNVDVTGRQSSGSSDNYYFGLYGGAQWGDFALRTGAANTLHDISTTRIVAVPGVSDSVKSDYTAGTAQVFGEFGYRMQADNVAFEPFANLAHVSINTSGFTERGGAAALIGSSTSTAATSTTFGLRASTAFDLNGANLTTKGMVGWRHAFGDGVPESAMRFAGGNTFSIAGVPVARDAVVVEAGLDLAITPNATLGASYNGQFGSGLTEQSFKANLTVRF
ncbi:autotransporter domain-containing protein [Shinella zoogloeoides]|uniref:autotransporter domain-containing protein n=1 Tax=Shinella zoogloeoides TaxID=352475 RepID=UPI0028B0D889|nr:autotransporter domain-containing protein [Shinella zoogloeoides]